jgi:hypothetical protein
VSLYDPLGTFWRLLMRWLTNWLNAGRRRYDLEILWPICKARAPDLDHAKAIFAAHAFNDDAWKSLGHHGIVAAIEALR